jgi:hypothetical protein
MNATRLRRLAYAIPRLPLAVAWSVIESRILGAAAFISRSGIPLSDFSAARESINLLRKVDDALELIGHHDSRRMRRIRADVSRIVVADMPGLRGLHLSRGRACYVHRSFVELRSPGLIALTIVHEATHRRIEQSGVWYWPDLKSRIEARCLREQVSFAQLLPRGSFSDVDEWLGRAVRDDHSDH